jgi:hypothetical protein
MVRGAGSQPTGGKPGDPVVKPDPLRPDPPAPDPPAPDPLRPDPPITARRPGDGRGPTAASGNHFADQPTGPVPVVGRANRPSLRDRLLPRSVLGLAALVMAAAVGAGFSGVVLYSYYDYRLSQNTDKINAFIGSYQKQFDNAKADIAAQRDAAKAEIDKQLGPLRQLQATADTLQALVKKVAPSMFFVHTLDANGQPSVGSAFVIASDSKQSLLLTSYTAVLAATRKPGPDLFIRQGGQDTKVTVWTWDERYDMALIILPRGGLPHINAAPASPEPNVGDRVFAVSGVGSLGGSAAQGVITDVSSSGLQHTAPVGQGFQGGPLLNASGDVIGLAVRGYQPLNFISDGVWFAPSVRSACQKVLSCPGGDLTGQPGGQRTG